MWDLVYKENSAEELMLLICGWRRLLIVPCTARRSNQSILKKISPWCSLEGLMLKQNSNILATWCEELTHLKRPWCWERLKAGEEGDNRRLGIVTGIQKHPTLSSWTSQYLTTDKKIPKVQKLNKDMEDLKQTKIQIHILHVKTIMYDMKNSQMGLKANWNIPGYNIIKLL